MNHYPNDYEQRTSGETDTVIFVGGKEYRISIHGLERMQERGISESWIAQVLNNPVAVVDDVVKGSTNYYGFIAGRNPLLKVPVSRYDDRSILTVHFDTPATVRYNRGEL